MHAISSYRGNRPTHPQTNTPSHKQTGLITIHCTAASVQCITTVQCAFHQTQHKTQVRDDQTNWYHSKSNYISKALTKNLQIKRQHVKWMLSTSEHHGAGIRPWRYSRTAAVPLASIAARGNLNGLPSSCRVLPKHIKHFKHNIHY